MRKLVWSTRYNKAIRYNQHGIDVKTVLAIAILNESPTINLVAETLIIHSLCELHCGHYTLQM